jgi:hypothetical protein
VRACTFVTAGTVGTRKFVAGDVVSLPEAFVRALVRRGVATDSPSPVAVPPPPPDDEPEAVEDRVTKPAPSLSRRALRKLLRRGKDA